MKKLYIEYFNKYGWAWLVVFLSIIGIIFTVAACSEPAIKIGTTGTDRILEGCNFENIYKFKFENHDYIMFETAGVNSRVAGIVHSPDCKYCNSNQISHESTKSGLSTNNSIP